MSKKNKSHMNKELQRWIKESKVKFDNKTASDVLKKKKAKGMCQICGERSAEAICIKCGKNVCKSCYFKLISVCKKCVSKEIAGKWDGTKHDWEEKLGVDWVE